MKQMKILITGASGFLAQYLRNDLYNQGHELILLSRQPLPQPLRIRETAITCDLSNSEQTKKALDNQRVDMLFHCASQQPRPNATFDDYFHGNVSTLNNVLTSIPLHQGFKCVLFSSAVVYGHIRHQVIDENTPTTPQNTYALTKLFGENLLKMLSEQHSFTGFCFRLPSLVGAKQPGGLIHTYSAIAQKNEPLEIYSKGVLKRNIMLFEDVSRLALQTLHTPTNPGYQLYLLGSENSLTLAEIAQYILKKLDSSSQIHLSDTPSPVEVDWDFNLKKAKKDLQFNPRGLEDSIDQFLNEAALHE